MSDEPSVIENPPPHNGGKMEFLFLALAPMPIGFSLGPLRLFDITQGNRSAGAGPLIFFNVFTIICCVTGAIGMCGGFKKGKWKARVGGVIFGLILWIVEESIILFIGCCQGFSHI